MSAEKAKHPDEVAFYAAHEMLGDTHLNLTNEQRNDVAYSIVQAGWQCRKVISPQAHASTAAKPGRPSKYHWSGLGVGQTMLIEGGNSGLRTSFAFWCSQNGITGAKITTRKVQGGIEVTRTA